MARPPIERSVEGVPASRSSSRPACRRASSSSSSWPSMSSRPSASSTSKPSVTSRPPRPWASLASPSGRVLERGRAKVAGLVGGKAIVIGGGQYRVLPRMRCFACRGLWVADAEEPGGVTSCPPMRLRRCECVLGARRARRGCRNDRDDPRVPGCGHGGGQRRSSERADRDRRTDESTTESGTA